MFVSDSISRLGSPSVDIVAEFRTVSFWIYLLYQKSFLIHILRRDDVISYDTVSGLFYETGEDIILSGLFGEEDIVYVKHLARCDISGIIVREESIGYLGIGYFYRFVEQIVLYILSISFRVSDSCDIPIVIVLILGFLSGDNSFCNLVLFVVDEFLCCSIRIGNLFHILVSIVCVLYFCCF